LKTSLPASKAASHPANQPGGGTANEQTMTDKHTINENSLNAFTYQVNNNKQTRKETTTADL